MNCVIKKWCLNCTKKNTKLLSKRPNTNLNKTELGVTKHERQTTQQNTNQSYLQKNSNTYLKLQIYIHTEGILVFMAHEVGLCRFS